MSRPDNKLGELSVLAHQVPLALEEIKKREDQLNEAKENHRKLVEEFIPDLMAELGISELKMENGSTLGVSQQYFAKIPKDRETEAFDWLKDNGFGSLIKTKVVESTGVHHQTLKAFVKEQMEAGNEIPQETFGVFVKQVTKITN